MPLNLLVKFDCPRHISVINICNFFRYSHVCNSSSKPKDYFIHQLTTNLLRHFINSELWNSLPCHVLVSVLARKLVLHILNLSSNPEILNYIVLNSIASKGVREKYNLAKYTRISITQYYDIKESAQKVPGEQTDQLDKPANSTVSQSESVNKPAEGIDTVDSLKIADSKETKEEIKAEIIPKKDESVQMKSPKKENLLSVDNRERKRSPIKKVSFYLYFYCSSTIFLSNRKVNHQVIYKYNRTFSENRCGRRT